MVGVWWNALWRRCWARLVWSRQADAEPVSKRRGRLGEEAARRHLCALGLRFLMANYKTKRGEIDLIMRDGDCLVFVELNTRTSEAWGRPAAAVNGAKRRRIWRAAGDYLKKLPEPRVKIRFDIVEVLMKGDAVREIRHWPRAFRVPPPSTFG